MNILATTYPYARYAGLTAFPPYRAALPPGAFPPYPPVPVSEQVSALDCSVHPPRFSRPPTPHSQHAHHHRNHFADVTFSVERILAASAAAGCDRQGPGSGPASPVLDVGGDPTAVGNGDIGRNHAGEYAVCNNTLREDFWWIV